MGQNHIPDWIGQYSFLVNIQGLGLRGSCLQVPSWSVQSVACEILWSVSEWILSYNNNIEINNYYIEVNNKLGYIKVANCFSFNILP